MAKSRKSVRCAHRLLSAFLAQRAKKGQWFLVSAIIIIAMISTVVLSSTQVKIGANSDPWQKYSFENLKAESSNAINSMMLENATSKNIEDGSKDYLDFLHSFGDSHGMDVSAYFIVGLPTGSGMNVSVINFAHSDLRDINITLDSTTKIISLLPEKSSETISFTSVPDRFNVNYTLTEVNATGWRKTENGNFQTTRKMFSAVKLRVKSKDDSQIREKIEWK